MTQHTPEQIAYYQQLVTTYGEAEAGVHWANYLAGNGAASQPQSQGAPTARPAFWDPDLHVPGESTTKKGMTVFLFGPLGTIKTTWAASWPSPVFLSAGHEGGDDSIAQLPELLGIEKPPVYQITSVSMMRSKVDYIARMHQQYGWKTVVIDSISFYADLWIAGRLKDYQDRGMDPQMQIRDWGLLETHICKEIAQRLHGLPLNVIWIALHKEKFAAPDKSGERTVSAIAPMLQGASAIKLPAMCKMVIYASKERVIEGSTVKMVPQFNTSPTRLTGDLVRHKYGNAFSEGHLVDPQCGSWPTFTAIDSRVGQFIYK
jgi:hypothetical protein